jgi:very-short-patch-repair endonuclease
LRANPTVAEIRFWRLIYPIRKPWHFRKQVRMGAYVVDFASHRARLVVEIDGYTHFVGDGPARDAVRDAALRRHGYEILRFTNLDVMQNAEGVYQTLLATLATRIPPP